MRNRDEYEVCKKSLKNWKHISRYVQSMRHNIRLVVISRQREHFAYTADIYPLVLAASYKQHNSRECL